MEKGKLSSKLIGIAGAFGLTFAMACATTTETDQTVRTERSNQAGAGQTADPLGPPQHIDSEITRNHPSSNTGAGNFKGAGANTNLNNPAPEARVTITESDAVITQTPIVQERVVVEPKPVIVETTVEEDDVVIETRRVTRKE